MTKKALFVSIDGMTDQLGQSQVLPYLIGLSKLGYTIEICSCEKKGNFEKNEKVVTDLVNSASIQWFHCFYDSGIPVVSQRNNFRKLSNLVKERIAANNNNVVLHCRSYMPALIGLTNKQKHAIPYVFDMRGFWADERIDGNIWKLRNPIHSNLYSYFKRQEKEMLSHADEIITLTEAAKQEILTWKLELKNEMEVIPCCADVDHFTISDKDQKLKRRSELGIASDEYVIGYLGALGTWYMLDEMLDFFKVYLKTNVKSKFLVITNDDESIVREVAARKQIPANCIVVRSANRKEVPEYISCFNIGLFFIKPMYSKKGSSPTKLAELLACGIPVVTNRGVGDLDAIIEQYKVGKCVDGFDELSYVKVVECLDELNTLDKVKLRECAENLFSLKNGIRQYDKVYKKVMK